MRVELIDNMGSDLSVVNSARVSFGKKKECFDESDEKLIKYLVSHKHMSPFRHIVFSFRCENIPEFVARQFYKHQVGCGYSGSEFRESATSWNEISQRYTEVPMDFYSIKNFRKQHSSNKQASTNDIIKENDKAVEIYDKISEVCYSAYKELLSLGVCREQARAVLPLSVTTSFAWTASLEAVAHFIKLRKHSSAQSEIVEIAKEIEILARGVAPISISLLVGENHEDSGNIGHS